MVTTYLNAENKFQIELEFASYTRAFLYNSNAIMLVPDPNENIYFYLESTEYQDKFWMIRPEGNQCITFKDGSIDSSFDWIEYDNGVVKILSHSITSMYSIKFDFTTTGVVLSIRETEKDDPDKFMPV